MRVEVWSPDGMEAVGQGPLTTVRAAENGPAVCLCDDSMSARVWLEPGEVLWLVGQLAVIRTRLLVAGLTAGPQVTPEGGRDVEARP